MPRGAVLVLLAALALVPARANAAVPVAIHPFKVPGLVGTQLTDFHALLQAGLASVARRGVLAPRSPTLLPATTCGNPQTAQCLADNARGFLILAGRGEVRRGVVLASAALWDSRGNRTREVRFAVDLVIENLRPITEALAELEAEVEQDGSVTPSGDVARAPAAAAAPPKGASPAPPGAKPPAYAVPLPPPPVLRGAPPATPAPGAAPAKDALAAAPRAAPAKDLAPAPGKAAPAREPAAAAKGAPEAKPISVAAPPPAPAATWKRTAGPWLLGGGLALVAGGAAVGLLNKQRADDLDAKYARGALAPSDHAAYDEVKRDNVISTALFAAGGVVAATGAWLWITAPSAGQPAVAAVGGRF